VLIRYMRATVRGWQDNLATPDKGAQLAVSKYGPDLGLDLTEQIGENKINNSLVTTDETKQKGILWISKDRVAGPITTSLKAAGEKSLPSASSYIDESIIRDAYAGKNKL